MSFNPASAFIATVGEDHTLVLPDSVPTGSRVAVGIIKLMAMTAPVQEPINETQEDAWDQLLALIENSPTGKLHDASELHDQYLYPKQS